MLSTEEIRTIHRILTRFPSKLAELEFQVTRQSQFGSQYSDGGKNAGEKPLYFDNAASEARIAMWKLIGLYATKIRHDWPTPWQAPYTGGKGNLHFLTGEVYSLRPYDEALEEFTEADKEIDRVIDIPRMRIYLGDCSACQTRLYGDPESDEMVCPGCACVHDPKRLRAENQRKGEGMVVTADDAKKYVGEVLGIPLTAGRLNRWVRLGYIVPIFKGGKGRGNQSTYRLGDVIRCVEERAKESGDRSVRT